MCILWFEFFNQVDFNSFVSFSLSWPIRLWKPQNANVLLFDSYQVHNFIIKIKGSMYSYSRKYDREGYCKRLWDRYKQGLWVMVFSSLTYTYSFMYIIIGIYYKTTHDMVKGWSVQFRIYFWQTHFEWSCLLVMLNLPVLQNQRLYFLRFGINTGGKRICEKLVKKEMKIKRMLLEKLWSSCLWNINRLVSF